MRQTLPAFTHVITLLLGVLSALEDDISKLKCEEGRMPLLVRPLTVVTLKTQVLARAQIAILILPLQDFRTLSIHKNVYFSSDVPKIFWFPDALVYHLYFVTSQTFCHITDILTCPKDFCASLSQADILVYHPDILPTADIYPCLNILARPRYSG